MTCRDGGRRIRPGPIRPATARNFQVIHSLFSLFRTTITAITPGRCVVIQSPGLRPVFRRGAILTNGPFRFHRDRDPIWSFLSIGIGRFGLGMGHRTLAESSRGRASRHVPCLHGSGIDLPAGFRTGGSPEDPGQQVAGRDSAGIPYSDSPIALCLDEHRVPKKTEKTRAN